MRRCPVLQCFKKESELIASFLFRKAENFEDASLDIAAVNSYRASADFRAIQHQVVCLGTYLLGMRFQHGQILIDRGRKRMMSRYPSILCGSKFQQRKIDDPEHVPLT